ncbi:hypothetical protein [Salinactinospora qingdaonensis]|uniref:MFS transporter n=1 Tax=Salinactinospora qingdaonensis TaxID=702744 RepID=A0ABP7FDS5_9ACTN
MSADQFTFRLLRASLFAVVCVGLGLAGHVFAGGGAPPAIALLGSGGALALLTVPFAGRQQNWTTLTVGLLTAQAILHLVFATAHAAPPAGAADPGPLCGAGASEGVSLTMALAHVWAAMVTGWWLAAGEKALWAVLRWLHAVLLALPPVTAGPLPAPAPRRRAVAPALALRLLVLRYTVCERAPPRSAPRAPLPAVAA